MANSRGTIPTDGIRTLFQVPFDYMLDTDVSILFRPDPDETAAEIRTPGVHFNWVSHGELQFIAAPAAGGVLDMIRSSGPLSMRTRINAGPFASASVNAIATQLLYLTQEIGDLVVDAATDADSALDRAPLLPINPADRPPLSGKVPVVQADGSWDILALPGIIADITFPRYPGEIAADDPYLWSGLDMTADGYVVDANFREVWLDSYYRDDTDTDMDALLYFADCMDGDTLLRLRGGKGRGPSGRYIIDGLVEITGGFRFILDQGEATVRFTHADGQIRYTGGFGSASGSVQPTDFFVVRNGICQIAAAGVKPYFWNISYRPSRQAGTGYAENVRVLPQNPLDATHQVQSVFVTKNTWYFRAINCHTLAKAQVVGAIPANVCMIEQQGVCVVTTVSGVEGDYFDKVIIPSFAPMVGAEVTFITGSYTRGKSLRQGANIAYFGRNDSAYGYTYSLYDEVGTLVPGAAEVLGFTGAVEGSATIVSVGRYYQPSEGFYIGGGSTFINSNYLINATAPANPDGSARSRLLNVYFQHAHMAFREGLFKLDYCADVHVATGAFLICSVAGGKIALDINHCDFLKVMGVDLTTNALGGSFLKGRNIDGGCFSHNTTAYVNQLWDLDNTVKSFAVDHNQALEGLGTVFNNANTGKRYNGGNTRGIRFLSNGVMGDGFDTDSPVRRAWVPVVTSEAGAITAYAVSKAHFSVSSGRLMYHCKVVVSNRGTASGRMYLTVTSITDIIGASGAVEHLGRASVANQNTCNAIWAEGAPPRIEVQGAPNNTTNDAFKIADVAGNYTYYVTGEVNVEYD